MKISIIISKVKEELRDLEEQVKQIKEGEEIVVEAIRIATNLFNIKSIITLSNRLNLLERDVETLSKKILDLRDRLNIYQETYDAIGDIEVI